MDVDLNQLVTERLHKGRQLIETRVVGARRRTHEYPPADAQDIATLERAGWLYGGQRPILRQCFSNRRQLPSTCLDAGTSYDGEFVEHDRRVFDKDSVWESIGARQHDYRDCRLPQRTAY